MCMYICIYIFYTLLALILRKTRIFKFFKISDPDPDPDLNFRIRIRIRLWSRIRSSDPDPDPEFLGSELSDPDPDPTKNGSGSRQIGSVRSTSSN